MTGLLVLEMQVQQCENLKLPSNEYHASCKVLDRSAKIKEVFSSSTYKTRKEALAFSFCCMTCFSE